MIDLLLDVKQRLVDQARELFAHIGSVAEYEALAGVPRSVPAAYVLPLSEVAGPAASLDATLQKHTCTFAVLFAARHAGDATGAAVASRLQALRDAVQGALVAWSVDGSATCTPIAFASGELIDFVDGTTLWRDTFIFDRWVQRAAA